LDDFPGRYFVQFHVWPRRGWEVLLAETKEEIGSEEFEVLCA
jgi:catalase